MAPKASPPPAYGRPLRGTSITIATFGVQARARDEAARAAADLDARFGGENGPLLTERAWFIDGAGYENRVFVAYWQSRSAYDRWHEGLDGWWDAPARNTGPVGIWREVVTVPSARFENIFSSPAFSVGAGHLTECVVGPIEAHGYWGSMRDRLAAAAHDPLDGTDRALSADRVRRPTLGRRVTVAAPPNLAVIRSGQDSSRCSDDERAEYERSILPVLGKGMDYLRDNPVESRCVSCRFLQETDADGKPTARSFGHAMFLSLADLERWSETHPTHLAIYHGFSAFAQRRGPALKLDLWHEVAVIEAGHGLFEYVNCHPATGLLFLVSEPWTRSSMEQPAPCASDP